MHMSHLIKLYTLNIYRAFAYKLHPNKAVKEKGELGSESTGMNTIQKTFNTLLGNLEKTL